MKDDFKPIPGYEGSYRINSDGVVQSSKKQVSDGHCGVKWIVTDEWHELTNHRTGTGHHQIRVTTNRQTKVLNVHRLVLTLFGPPIPFEGALALHKDDNPDHNSVDNLYWGTSKNNRADAMRSGKAVIPRTNILTDKDVAVIRAHPRYYGYKIKLAQQFGVSPATIKDIVRGRSWKEVNV